MSETGRTTAPWPAAGSSPSGRPWDPPQVEPTVDEDDDKEPPPDEGAPPEPVIDPPDKDPPDRPAS